MTQKWIFTVTIKSKTNFFFFKVETCQFMQAVLIPIIVTLPVHKFQKEDGINGKKKKQE